MSRTVRAAWVYRLQRVKLEIMGFGVMMGEGFRGRSDRGVAMVVENCPGRGMIHNEDEAVAAVRIFDSGRDLLLDDGENGGRKRWLTGAIV